MTKVAHPQPPPPWVPAWLHDALHQAPDHSLAQLILGYAARRSHGRT